MLHFKILVYYSHLERVGLKKVRGMTHAGEMKFNPSYVNWNCLKIEEVVNRVELCRVEIFFLLSKWLDMIHLRRFHWIDELPI